LEVRENGLNRLDRLPWVLVCFFSGPWVIVFVCTRFTFAAWFRLTDRTSLLKLFCWAAAALGNQSETSGVGLSSPGAEKKVGRISWWAFPDAKMAMRG